MIKYAVLLISLVLLAWCGSTSKEIKTQNISFWNFNMQINNDYTITNIKPSQEIKNTTILLEYKEKKYSDLSPSLVIYKYNWEYPNNINKFASIILEKFQKNVIWSKILDNEIIKIDNNQMFYFTYSISNNIFSKDSKTDYFWLQAYIFWQNKKMYIISFIWENKKQLDNMVADIKNLKYNK